MRRSILRSSGVRRSLAAKLAARLALGLVPVILTAGCGFGGGGVSPVRTSFNKGVYHYSRGNLDEAIAEYRLALEENEGDRHARFNLAVALEAKARRRRQEDDSEAAEKLERRAEDEYRALVEENPEFLRAIVNLAACEYDLGQRDAAAARLADAIERFDGAALPHVALATQEFRTLRGEASLGTASRAAFESLLKRIDAGLDRDPASIQGNMLRGDVHAELARRARSSSARTVGTSALGLDAETHVSAARASYEKALLREPSDIATLLALGHLEKEERSWAVAATFFERVSFIDPDHFEARLSLSEVLTRMGDVEGATYNLWRARALDRPRNPRLSPQEYGRRLVSLYEKLANAEKGQE